MSAPPAAESSATAPASGVAAARPAAPHVLVATHDSTDANELRLRRAAADQKSGDAHGVIDDLEAIDFSTEPAFAGADRAAFLLAQAYLRAGSLERFATLADAVGRWPHATIYTQWLAGERQWLAAARRDSSAAGPLPVNAATGSAALTLYLRARAAGADSASELTALAHVDTISMLGRTLAGAARLRLAALAAAHGEDPRPLLASVPSGTRFSSNARHLLGVAEIERGDTVAGRATLAALIADDSTYAGRREVMLALAGSAMDAEQWDAAYRAYEAIDGDWGRNRDALRRMLSGDDDAALWSAWTSGAWPSDALVIDAVPARTMAQQLADASADLGASPALAPPLLDAPARAPALRWPVAPPSEPEWRAVADADRARDEAAYGLERARRSLAVERDGLGDRRRYLGFGLTQDRNEMALLAERNARLDTLRRSLDALDARLRGVRDAATRRLLARAADVVAQTANSLAWIEGMRHFHVDGPRPVRPLAVPSGFPAPDTLLIAEESLARAVAASAESLAAGVPSLISRSYAQAWRPRLIDAAVAQSGEAALSLRTARRLETVIDSSVAAAGGSAELRRLAAQVATLERDANARDAAARLLRARVAHAAVERTLATLQTEREGIDYGLAASAYAASVRLDGTDSSVAAATPDTSGVDDVVEAPKTRELRERAIRHLQAFLAIHPQAAVRGEVRFQLADLLLVDARQTFREQMAQFVRDQGRSDASPGRLPVVDAAPALALYRSILAEDHDYAHLDAVLFNAGMILADDGDPEASRLFAQLVTEHPTSRYCQEAYLRMGDALFNAHNDEDCVPLFQHATEGPDPTLRAIAFYKMGWAHFSEDRFIPAADAFRAILDLDSSGTRVANHVNLQDEAEAYFVHSLARAGGADAFASYFDQIGPRPYEMRVLRNLAQHFRRYSLYAQAAAADGLLISRYPLHPDALASAERMVETYQRWDRAALERQARLDQAPRFAPGSDWAKAQTSDSVRAAGAAFARDCLLGVAIEAHRAAREGGSRENWQEALHLYTLVLDKWPEDAGTAALELRAGEAAAELKDYPVALAHYGNAARGGRDSVATLAMWQRVAVTDAWYESTRVATTPGGPSLGRDSLAHAVIATAEELLKKYPEHPHAADLMWRQGNLEFAHGWFEPAADAFARMATRAPADTRVPRAEALRADATYRLGRFGDAGAAYEEALAAARHAGADSLARRAEQAIPVCYYRDAEAAVAADSTAYAHHAELFEKVASRFPAYEHADLARYRSGLAYLKAGKAADAVRSMRALLADSPKSEYVKDAQLQIANTLESQGQHEQAAQAYVDFAARFPADAQSGSATLKAADLFAAAGLTQRADELRIGYVRQHPEDVETAMDVLEGLAKRDLDGVDAQHPVSKLLAPTGKKAKPVPPPSRLAEYLALADAHPKAASREIVARVRFLEGEEAGRAYAAAPLKQPLAPAIAAKQKLLNAAVARYRQCVDLGVPEWSHASTYRIGEALVAFGEALEKSERPADLHGEDLQGYEEVLLRQSQAFGDKGETVWTDLLKQPKHPDPADAWTQKAQAALWHRLGDRFAYMPEAEFPLVQAEAAHRVKPVEEHAETTSKTKSGGGKGGKTRAREEGAQR